MRWELIQSHFAVKRCQLLALELLAEIEVAAITALGVQLLHQKAKICLLRSSHLGQRLLENYLRLRKQGSSLAQLVLRRPWFMHLPALNRVDRRMQHRSQHHLLKSLSKLQIGFTLLLSVVAISDRL